MIISEGKYSFEIEINETILLCAKNNMRLRSFKMISSKCLEIIYLIYMYKKDFRLK